MWRLEVTLATPKTETGTSLEAAAALEPTTADVVERDERSSRLTGSTEKKKVLKAMETTLHKTALKVVAIVNKHKDHIPPITTSETNPFPYQIILNPRVDGWAKPLGLQ